MRTVEPDRQQSFAVWITGLPASGKSTIAAALKHELNACGVDAAVLESDVMRSMLMPQAGYDENTRDQFYRQVAYIGSLLTSHGVPVTYVPARNTVFLSYALAWSEILGAHDIFIGVNAVDYSGYPDCRPEYIAAFERMANLATRAGTEGREPLFIRTPLIQLSKAEIIRQGRTLGVDYSLTVSCYQADDEGRACGLCDACRIRRAGFDAAQIEDPTRYRSPSPPATV